VQANRNYDGSTEEGDEEEVTLHRRKATTKRSQRRVGGLKWSLNRSPV